MVFDVLVSRTLEIVIASFSKEFSPEGPLFQKINAAKYFLILKLLFHLL